MPKSKKKSAKKQTKKVVAKPAVKKAAKKAPPVPLAQAAVQEVMEQVMLASPAPDADKAADEESRKKATAIAAAQGAEVKRLDTLGLVEVPVRGSPYKLVGLVDPKAEPSIEQRVEIAKRLNAVGPLLPRYVQRVVKKEEAKPSVTPGEAMPKKSDSGIPGVTKAEIEKAHADNLKQLEGIEKDKEKRRKEEEKKRKTREAVEAAQRKKRDVSPKVTVPKDEPKKAGKSAATAPAAKKAAPPKKVKTSMKPLEVPKGGFNKSNVPATSGELIRARITEHKMSDEEIATEVRKLFPGRNTKVSDVRWNRGQMRKHGVDAPDPVGEEAPPAKGGKKK